MERRRQVRTPIQLPVKIRPKSPHEEDRPELSGLTRDLTSSGIFLYTDSALQEGAKLELVLMLPPSLGIGAGGWTLCQASVVRVEPSDAKGMGVAAIFDRIEQLPQI
jgi:c-di-GMP-binding flagellar brake protein YcgR